MRRILLAAALAITAPAIVPSKAAAVDDDAALFMERFGGEWRGSGRLLVGPESGLRFHCALAGDPSRSQMAFGMTGRCWTGSLSAPVYARLRYSSDQKQFFGSFMDGAEGDGANIVGERSGEGFMLKLVRGELQGRLAAEPAGPGKMTVTLSLYDPGSGRTLPVAAMGFARPDADALPIYDPTVTGSIERTGER
ncbi:hypothetical protein [Afifella sp. IM 167]|uniref:hypothetical protein n=1 Tax=Afifella sp. IM 167 TaxID=2033586 RepID=UPI001CC9985D|nr:hypothetical protein [Afifella sp. IM 167]MBZ8134728.1 hypothetical protein [Afifella sp. IM 167]